LKFFLSSFCFSSFLFFSTSSRWGTRLARRQQRPTSLLRLRLAAETDSFCSFTPFVFLPSLFSLFSHTSTLTGGSAAAAFSSDLH
jgi:energy-coupling factor transporter transmembrane protein EcfT